MSPKVQAPAIEVALRSALGSAGEHMPIGGLAQLLAEVLNDAVTREQAQDRLSEQAGVMGGLIRSLVGKSLVQGVGQGDETLSIQAQGDVRIDQSRRVIDFGSSNQIGSVTIYGGV